MTTASASAAPLLSRRLARMLAALMALCLGVTGAIIFSATAVRLRDAQAHTLATKTEVLSRFIEAACLSGERGLFEELRLFEPARASARLTLRRGDGTVLFAEPLDPAFRFRIGRDFSVDAPAIPGGKVLGRLELDVTHDTRMLEGLAVTLIAVTLGGAALTGLGIRWLVRRGLRQLADLAAQTRAITPQRLDQRLRLDRPARELQPWIEHFNALMDRLEGAYAQLEGFNADVAHELRTPLATLIGQTELALSRERPAASLRETLASNLEEMQRLSAMVNDMLFLSSVDRGATARRGQPVSLAGLARQVAEFHESALAEAGLGLEVVGDAVAPVDEALVKRALSNLLGNATRFAQPGSTLRVKIAAAAAPAAPAAEGRDAQAPEVEVAVQNRGAAIAVPQLSRLFDRFYRGDDARSHDGGPHHGLGLAIVAAIARMHAGRLLARSRDGVTEIGFTVAG
jgi:two-component system heavy metal sensor histidine kinase CusS